MNYRRCEMDRDGVRNMMLWLKTIYPDIHAEHINDPNEMTKKIDAWYNILYVIKKEDMRKILNNYIRSEARPPTIADIMKSWNRNNSGKDMEEWRKKHEKR